jgi:hypothetical protein
MAYRVVNSVHPESNCIEGLENWGYHGSTSERFTSDT